MRYHQYTDRTPGFSLVEMLVAIAIFAIAVTVAFVLYNSEQKSYKAGEEQVELQQTVRQAFDRMVSDLRLAGFNVNPDGDPTRDDEQIEGAWDTAITIRADFDHEDPIKRADPELNLAGSAYKVVSTGNDEIITYVLAKPGPKGDGTLQMGLDPDRPRTKKSKEITIPDVVQVQDDPPYTLYRVSLVNIQGAFPAAPQPASSFVYEPVAENVLSLTFDYLDANGARLNQNTPADPRNDIGGSEEARQARSRIRQIGLRLVGMARAPDLAYTDPDDPGKTRHFRKFELKAVVTPKNLGLTGLKDSDTVPPTPPTDVGLVAGHCKSILVRWAPPDPEEGVTSYSVRYWPRGSSSAVSVLRVPYPEVLLGGIDRHGHGLVSDLADGVSYCFQVQASDASGNTSDWAPTSSIPCIQVTEASTPGAPKHLEATGGRPHSSLDSRIKLTWDEVRTNTTLVPGDPDTLEGVTVIRDANSYKIYRGLAPGFMASDSSNLLGRVGAQTFEYTDSTAANCKDYYYKVLAVDNCGVESGASAVASGRAETSLRPAAPAAVNARRPSKASIEVSWNPVTTSDSGTPMFIEQYKLYRDKSLVSPTEEANRRHSNRVNTDALSLRATMEGGVTSYVDVLDASDQSDLSRGWHFIYAVSAADACGNESAKSEPAEISCLFEGDWAVSPANMSIDGGIVPIILRVVGNDTFVRSKVRIAGPDNPEREAYSRESFSFPPHFATWDSTLAGPGAYTIRWEVENQKSCIKQLTTTFTVKGDPVRKTVSPDPMTSLTDQDRSMTWNLINTSGKELGITEIEVSWESKDVSPQLVGIEFPSGRLVSNFQNGMASGARGDYSHGPLALPSQMNGLCGDPSCSIPMTLSWDSRVRGDKITVIYHYQDPMSAVGTTTLTVEADGSIH